MAECIAVTPLQVQPDDDDGASAAAASRMLVDRLLLNSPPPAAATCPPPGIIVQQPGPLDFYYQLVRPQHPADFVLNLLTLLLLALTLYSIWSLCYCRSRGARR
jgi:hypothetical protein